MSSILMCFATNLIGWSRYLAVLILAIGLAGCSDPGPQHHNLIEADLPEPLRGSEQVAVDLDRADPIAVEPDFVMGDTMKSDGIFLAQPMDMIVVGDSIYIADVKQHAIVVADLRGRLIRLIGGQGQAPGEFTEPARLAANDDFIFVYDHGNRRVQVFDHRFEYITSISHGFMWLRQSIVADDDQLFLPESVMSDSLMVAVHTARQPFQKEGGFMPRLLPPGQQPMAHNTSVVTTDGSNVCSAYIGLPYVFCFDNDLSEQRTLVFNGGVVENLNNPLPSQIEFSGDESTSIRPFVMGFALRDDMLFLASHESPIYIISLKTNRLLGMLPLPASGIVDQIHVGDERLLLLMGVSGYRRVYAYDVVHILNELHQEAPT